jgi:hypothetical protein
MIAEAPTAEQALSARVSLLDDSLAAGAPRLDETLAADCVALLGADHGLTLRAMLSAARCGQDNPRLVVAWHAAVLGAEHPQTRQAATLLGV